MSTEERLESTNLTASPITFIFESRTSVSRANEESTKISMEVPKQGISFQIASMWY